MDQNEGGEFDELLIERKKKNLQLELEKCNTLLDQSALKRKRADEEIMKFEEEQKMEKENLQMKLIEWEKTMNSKQALELEIQHVIWGNRLGNKDKMDEMKHVLKEKDEEIEALKKSLKEKELENEHLKELSTWEEENLEEKDEEIESLEELNTVLTVKERYANEELIEARNELITLVREQEAETKKKGKFEQSKIGVKIMGDLEKQVFSMECSSSHKVIDNTIILSEWENRLRDPKWHPFIVVEVEGGGHKEIIDEDDVMLKELKEELGIKAFEAVCTALKEMNEYNPSGRYPVPELWDFDNQRKATLKEGISHLMNLMK